MNPEATLEMVRALSEGRLKSSTSALWKQKIIVPKRLPTPPRIGPIGEIVRKLIEAGKIHVLQQEPIRINDKRKLFGY